MTTRRRHRSLGTFCKNRRKTTTPFSVASVSSSSSSSSGGEETKYSRDGEDDFGGDDEKYENWGVKPSPERGAIEGYSLERFETLVDNYAHVWVTRAFVKGEKQVGETTGRVNDRAV